MEDASAAAAAISACDELSDHFAHPNAAVLTPAEARAAGALIGNYLSVRTPMGNVTAALATVWDRVSA